MNRYDEVTGLPLQTESPKKDFGVPLPGDPSLAFTLEKNKLADIYGRFSDSLQMLGEHPEAREIMDSRGLTQPSATGRFQPQGADLLEQQRREMMSMGNTGLVNINSYGNLGGQADIPNGAAGASGLAPLQRDAVSSS